MLKEAQKPSEKALSLIQLVGTQVRAARTGVGFSRRELAERSGVSMRYLAQLEGGEGNISIGLLQQVATALELPIEALITETTSQTAELRHVTALYQKADVATRARALQVLDPTRERKSKAERICLIGLRGAGKSTLGALLASDLGVPFLELNTEIEARIGVPVREIIALYGEDGYRQIEAETLNKIIATHERLVLAVAGGIVSSPQTFDNVLTDFHTIWIKAQPSEHMDRVRAQGDLRPMAGNPQAMEQLRQILKTRERHYAKASYQLDTSGQNIQTSRAELNALLKAHNISKSHKI
ncbi:shikimate kinase [Planktotalea frisia]|jgi:XRE family aerobic/anaerobic benzoate catabolism transcriptional regulator|uniref:Shikimate kinase n=1 Tax=Planktotalea frisia TaxID=696762 RepID=A0A1L9NZM4_9RHOB|nr:helix-turn-helix transcriptional regulator [Planktotalea frisia]OJI94745.1 shikimate kinase [Planktotalea frisia]PZX31054.1 shikimate kinase [Planktotalea frisia]